MTGHRFFAGRWFLPAVGAIVVGHLAIGYFSWSFLVSAAGLSILAVVIAKHVIAGALLWWRARGRGATR